MGLVKAFKCLKSLLIECKHTWERQYQTGGIKSHPQPLFLNLDKYASSQDACWPNRVKLTALEVLFVNWISFPFITSLSLSVRKLPSSQGKLENTYLKSAFKLSSHATMLRFRVFQKCWKGRQKSSRQRICKRESAGKYESHYKYDLVQKFNFCPCVLGSMISHSNLCVSLPYEYFPDIVQIHLLTNHMYLYTHF